MSANSIAGGYAGSILSIDLSNRSYERIALDPDLAASFMGGQGINSKLAYDLIKPGVDPLSPENVIIFGAGTLVGTMSPTAARATVTSKSPVNGFIGYSNAGHFGAMLKLAGYDHLIINGKADRPVYLAIEDDRVAFADAAHLWGKDIYAATDQIWAEVGDDHWVSCIGPAGENLVRYASIINNKHSAFGRSGLGTVMGSKNLKAVATRGTKSIAVAERGKFMSLVGEVLRRMDGYPEAIDVVRRFGTQSLSLLTPYITLTRLPRLADTETIDPERYLETVRVGNIACPACPIGCKAWMETRDGTGFGASCTWGTVTGVYGVGLSIRTYADTAKTARLGQMLGLDSMLAGSMISLAIELYEAGIITKADTDGLELAWGDVATIDELLRRIALRQGFGNTLADGVVAACERIGRGSEAYAMHIKGLTMQPEMYPDIRAVVSSEQLGCMVNARGFHIDGYRRPTLYGAGGPPAEVIAAYGSHIGIPKDKQDQIVSGDSYDIPAFTKHVEEFNLVLQSLGSCDRAVAFRSTDIDMLAALYSAATGITATPTDLLRAGERIVNVQRAFNYREGASRRDDMIPERLFRESIETRRGIQPPADAQQLNALLDRYYELHGWDVATGKPTVAILERLGLDSVAGDLAGQPAR